MRKENDEYLNEQIITYIGNKRKIIPYIEAAIREILQDNGWKRVSCADLFSGSGIAARCMKQYAHTLIVNDLETYSRVINECYLSNASEFDAARYDACRVIIDTACRDLKPGFITELYAPQYEFNIRKGERVFFTPRNAMFIDTVRQSIDTLPEDMRKYFLAPLLAEVSVHANTSGVFKGFYKDSRRGIGKYGGNGENALTRIKGEMRIHRPVLSAFASDVRIFQEDINTLADRLPAVDIAYLDPPYNQHPYGSNYFMLNTVCSYTPGERLSRVSGIPFGWNRSVYNKRARALPALEELIGKLKAEYIILSYNSEGFITPEEMTAMLSRFGDFRSVSIRYNTFRGSRNLRSRSTYVDEYIFIVKKARMG